MPTDGMQWHGVRLRWLMVLIVLLAVAPNFALHLMRLQTSSNVAVQRAYDQAAVLAEAGAKPEHVTSMTWYLTDKKDYLGNLEGIGKVYREVMGRNFPAMAVVEVTALVEDRAKVEIQAIAVVPT